jgi:hypothetical protein
MAGLATVLGLVSFGVGITNNAKAIVQLRVGEGQPQGQPQGVVNSQRSQALAETGSSTCSSRGISTSPDMKLAIFSLH